MNYLFQKSFQALLLFVFSVLMSSLKAQSVPDDQWKRRYGGSGVDIPLTIKLTSDGGSVIGGYTDSKNGDVEFHTTREYWDLWIVKTNACGIIQWEKSMGGTGYESARDIAQTSDGGYIVLGETNSTDGDVIKGYGGTKDIWLIKLDAAGNVQWQKRFGGSGSDIGNRIKIDNDGSYFIAATSSSNDGDIKGNHATNGFSDGVLMKVSASGTLLWSKCFGGSKNEELFDIVLINDKLYSAGYSNSIDGDIPPSQKNYDVWLLALDGNGNKIFSKVYGGSQNDVAYSMAVGSNGNFTLAGYTTSRDGDVTVAKGSQDFWVLNIDQTGKLIWQKTLGGSEADYANTIISDNNNGFLIGGISYSSDGDKTESKGNGDYWVVKLDAQGKFVWQKSWGGNGNDHLRCIVQRQTLNEYYLVGDSDSNDGDFNFQWGYGEADFSIIKLKEPILSVKDSAVCSLSQFVPVSDTIRDQCGYDSAIITYKPALLKSPLYNLKHRDTIFKGESYTLPSIQNGTISWGAHSSLSCTNCSNPVARPTSTTVYNAVNTSPLGCMVEDRFTLVVLTEALVLTPDAFTPNNDGLNDWFGPIGKVPNSYTMQIYNRFGEMVYQSQKINNRWDGRYKGLLQPPGSYVYVIRYEDMLLNTKEQRGNFILIR